VRGTRQLIDEDVQRAIVEEPVAEFLRLHHVPMPGKSLEFIEVESEGPRGIALGRVELIQHSVVDLSAGLHDVLEHAGNLLLVDAQLDVPLLLTDC